MLSWKILTDVARACALMMFISVSAWNCAAVNPHTTAPDAAEAEAFMSRVNEEAKRLMVEVERAHWVYSNFITLDTQEIAAEADERWMAWLSKTIKDATRYDGMEHPQALSRQFQILKQGVTLPAPGDPALRSELAGITSSLSAAYGKGVYCPVQGGALRTALETVEANSESLACDAGRGGVPLGTLTRFMATSRDAAALKEAWVGWRKISIPMRGDFARYVALGNQGAQEIGFADLGELWRSGYDMPPEAFRLEAERLWEQLKPFYEELHCYVRLKLADAYGANVVPSGGPIPAHLLGNMWSQTWGNIYDMVEPFPAEASLDVTKTLEAQGYDEVRMVKLAEGFFTSLGLDPLPETFYERSLLKKPRDRDVQCHASAWDVHYNNDLRIKMCIETDAANFETFWDANLKGQVPDNQRAVLEDLPWAPPLV